MTDQNDTDAQPKSPVPNIREELGLGRDSSTDTDANDEELSLIRSHAKGGELFQIFIVNVVLSILTLGIYRFWGKTRMRRYLWGHVEVMGDRLEYTGTGQELFLGFLFVFFLILLPVFGGFAVLDNMLMDADPIWQGIKAIVQMVVILFLVSVAIFRARRYRLTRTHWRGIYGGQTGSSLKYGFLGLGCYLLTLVTLGLAWPLCSVWLARFEMDNTWIGDQQPEFNPRVATLYKSYAVFWVFIAVWMGLVVSGAMSFLGADGEPDLQTEAEAAQFITGVIGVYASLILLAFAGNWYQGKAISHFVSRTRFHNHELASSINGMNFLWLSFSNWMLQILTLGLATPWTFTRALNYIEVKVDLVGDGDFSALLQSTQEKPTTGEGLADAFDIGGI
ncbi:YjgN family protein [Pseudomonadota bacterium]